MEVFSPAAALGATIEYTGLQVQFARIVVIGQIVGVQREYDLAAFIGPQGYLLERFQLADRDALCAPPRPV